MKEGWIEKREEDGVPVYSITRNGIKIGRQLIQVKGLKDGINIGRQLKQVKD